MPACGAPLYYKCLSLFSCRSKGGTIGQLLPPWADESFLTNIYNAILIYFTDLVFSYQFIGSYSFRAEKGPNRQDRSLYIIHICSETQ